MTYFLFLLVHIHLGVDWQFVGRYMFTFIQNAFLKSGCAVLYSHQQLWEFQVLRILGNTCTWYDQCIILAILVGVWWYLIVPLLGISLMINDVECVWVLMHHLHIFFCELSASFAHFFIVVVKKSMPLFLYDGSTST